MANGINSNLIIQPEPGREDIDRVRREISAQAEILAAREQELVGIRLALARFEARYHQEVSSRYAQLDELKARIAEARAKRSPRDPWLDRQAQRARSGAAQTARAYQSFDQAPPPADPEVQISVETRKLYHRIAAEIHPDKAGDERTRDLRTRLMAELNEAYARGDQEWMQEILHHWQASPEAVTGQDSAARLTRLRRTLENMQRKVAEIDQDLRRLRNSELHVLLTSCRQAERSGRDLLRELAQTIEEQIEEARRELAGIGGGAGR